MNAIDYLYNIVVLRYVARIAELRSIPLLDYNHLVLWVAILVPQSTPRYLDEKVFRDSVEVFS